MLRRRPRSALFPDTTLCRSVRDYRSTPQVVGLANGVLAAAGRAGTSTAARLQLVAQRPAGPEPVFTEHDDETAEAAGVAVRRSEEHTSELQSRQYLVCRLLL